jgi:hypothetical protein
LGSKGKSSPRGKLGTGRGGGTSGSVRGISNNTRGTFGARGISNNTRGASSARGITGKRGGGAESGQLYKTPQLKRKMLRTSKNGNVYILLNKFDSITVNIQKPDAQIHTYFERLITRKISIQFSNGRVTNRSNTVPVHSYKMMPTLLKLADFVCSSNG